MTKDQFKSRVISYLQNNMRLDERIDTLINSGAIDTDNLPDDFSVIKPTAHAVLMSVTADFRPLSRDGLKDSENMQQFV